MKRALIGYHHGLGDVVMLTPHLRHLHDNGYIVDLMCRDEVGQTNLLGNCKYVDKIIKIENPWRSENFQQQLLDNFNKFVKLSGGYDFVGFPLHLANIPGEHKIDMTSRELGIKLDDRGTEVFLGERDDSYIRRYIGDKFSDGYIVVNSSVEFHTCHSWDARTWIKENLPELPILELGKGGDHYRKWPDINKTAALLRHASYLVLNSSVFVHIADALGCDIEVINYGNEDTKMNTVNVEARHIRRMGKWER